MTALDARGTRRRARRPTVLLAIAAVATVAATACGSPPAKDAAPPAALHLDPPCDLASPAGLIWVLEASPREIAQSTDVMAAIAQVLSEDRLTAFSNAHGGIDLRQMNALCVGRYRSSWLAIARAPLSPDRVERAFRDRAVGDVTRTIVAPNPPIVRLSADVDDHPERVTLFARELAAWEISDAGRTRDKAHGAAGPRRPGPLAVAETFALQRLKRSRPALHTLPLARTAVVVGPAPLRVFVPGPFEGESAAGFGGLLRTATAVGAAVRFAGPDRVRVRLALLGAWADPSAASDRLVAAVHVMTESSLGRLLGIEAPLDGPSVRVATSEGGDVALVLEGTLDALKIGRGLHDALDAEVRDILRMTP